MSDLEGGSLARAPPAQRPPWTGVQADGATGTSCRQTFTQGARTNMLAFALALSQTSGLSSDLREEKPSAQAGAGHALTYCFWGKELALPALKPFFFFFNQKGQPNLEYWLLPLYQRLIDFNSVHICNLATEFLTPVVPGG